MSSYVGAGTGGPAPMVTQMKNWIRRKERRSGTIQVVGVTTGAGCTRRHVGSAYRRHVRPLWQLHAESAHATPVATFLSEDPG